MGRSITPTYRVEYLDNATRSTNWALWNGRASVKRLENWRQEMNRSFLPNGGNAHISEACGVVVHIHKAWIIRQSDNEIVCSTKAPMFEVV